MYITLTSKWFLDFAKILKDIEEEHRVQKAAPRAMKQFTQSEKFENTATSKKAMFEQVGLIHWYKVRLLWVTE